MKRILAAVLLILLGFISAGSNFEGDALMSPAVSAAPLPVPTSASSSSASLGGPIVVGGPGYSAHSPHWPHMNVFNAFRMQCFWSNGNANWLAARDFIQSHVDMTDDCAYRPYFTIETAGAVPNPTMQYLGYTIDLSTCVSAVAVPPYITGTATNSCGLTLGDGTSGGLPESAFLHWADNTTATFDDGAGHTWGPKTYTCSGAATLACRIEGQVATFGRQWFFNVNDASYRAVQLAHLAGAVRHHVFLDAHWNDLFLQGAIVSGGHVLEYPLGGGLYTAAGNMNNYAGLAATGTCFGSTQLTAYEVDVCQWLRTLSTTNAPTRYYPNVDGQVIAYWQPPDGSLPRTGKHEAAGAMSYSTEAFNLPQMFSPGSGNPYNTYLEFVRTYTAAGGYVLDYGSPQVEPGGSVNYNAGNYATQHSRAYMWYLAHYYMMKEAMGSLGKVWFSPFYFNVGQTSGHELDFTLTSGCSDSPTLTERCVWLPAYQVDVGIPSDQWRFAVQGAFGTTATTYAVNVLFTVPASQPQMTVCAGQQYNVFFRLYTKALVLIRALDACSDYGDASALLINLETPHVILNEDGTHSAPVRQVTLRMGEALILGNP